MNLFRSRLIVFGLGFIVGGALAAAFSLRLTVPELSATASQTNQPTATSTVVMSSDVSVYDQPAGDTVTVESVTVPPPGVWVAVQDLNADGSLGNVLGAARVGYPRMNVVVTLLRNTVTGHKYAVVLYRDDGNGIFDAGGDSIYVDFDTGEPVQVPFTAQ